MPTSIVSRSNNGAFHGSLICGQQDFIMPTTASPFINESGVRKLISSSMVIGMMPISLLGLDDDKSIEPSGQYAPPDGRVVYSSIFLKDFWIPVFSMVKYIYEPKN